MLYLLGDSGREPSSKSTIRVSLSESSLMIDVAPGTNVSVYDPTPATFEMFDVSELSSSILLGQSNL